jgi:uncharacterized membrane protein YbhN (UPF0104 family)
MAQNVLRLGWFLKFGFGFLLFFSLLRLLISPEDISHLLNIHWYKAWHVILWTLLINILAAWRWHILLNSFSNRSNFIKLLGFTLFGRIAGQSTSQIAGDLGSRFVYLKSRNIEMKQGGFTILFDKILEGILFIAVVVVFLGTIFSVTLRSHASFALIFAIFLFLAGVWMTPLVSSVIGRFFKKEDFPNRVSTILSDRTGWMVIILTLGKYAASAMRFMFILQLCGIDLLYSEVIMGTAVAQIGLIAGITPGGLGIMEAGWAGALYTFGITAPLVAQFLVAQRLLIFCSVLVLSLMYVFFERRYIISAAIKALRKQ